MSGCPHIHKESRDNFRALEESIARGECAAWIGSGPSQTSNFPSWSRLCCHLAKECDVKDFQTFKVTIDDSQQNPDIQQQVLDHVAKAAKLRRKKYDDPEFLIDLAQEAFDNASKTAKRKTTSSKYDKTLLRIFARYNINQATTYDHLTRVAFACLITTNFDYTLKHAFQHADMDYHDRARQCYAYPNLPTVQANGASLFYVHGIIEEGAKRINRIVLRRSDFLEAYGRSGQDDHHARVSRDFLTEVLKHYAICFIGADPKDQSYAYVTHRVQLFDTEYKNTFDSQRPKKPRFRLTPIPAGHSIRRVTVGTSDNDDKYIYYNDNGHALVELREIAEYLRNRFAFPRNEQAPLVSPHSK